MTSLAYRISLQPAISRRGGLSPADTRELLEVIGGTSDPAALRRASRAMVARHRTSAAAVLAVFGDLASQGWAVTVEGLELCVIPASAVPLGDEQTDQVKQRVRAGLEAHRAEDLAAPAVRAFLREVEGRRLFSGRRTSILDVIDDGAALSRELRAACSGAQEVRAGQLLRVVEPVIEVVTPEARCTETGIALGDVWRYFRHTWALPYRTVPGRGLAFLIRNGARPGRPVMGIGALSSPVPQLHDRDEWLGWSFDAFCAALRSAPTAWPGRLDALRTTLRTAAAEVKVDDLIPEGCTLSGGALEELLLEVSKAASADRAATLLREQGRGARRGASREAPTTVSSGTWLFVKKRARVASELLRAARHLDLAPRTGAEALDALQRDEDLARALRTALREVRKVGLASRVLDLNVCGAVAPYGGLLTGKLVALAAASAELAQAYRDRYSAAPSIIASEMAGRPIVREADFCAVTTTSLYGVASSQYNRLKVEVEYGGRRNSLRWEEIGRTEGVSAVHLSGETVDLLREVAATEQHQNVNNVFGEGPSPRLRQAREGLACLFSPVDALLAHGSHRRIYALEIVPGARAALLANVRAAPDRLPFASIARAWSTRWLRPRVERGDALQRVEQEGPSTVVARLRADDAAQLDLFSS